MTGMAWRERTASRRGSAIGHLISFSLRVPASESHQSESMGTSDEGADLAHGSETAWN
jgi:hypothetical protein